MTVLARAARGESAAFAALHCPLVSGAETAPLGGGGSPSPQLPRQTFPPFLATSPA